MAKLSSLHSSRFRRYPDEGYIGGVCAGISEFLGWNVRMIRALAVLSFIFGGFFPIVLVYGLLWYVMEETRGTSASPDRGYESSGPGDLGGGSGSGAYASRSYGGSSDIGGRPTTSADLKSRFSRLEQRLSSMEDCVTSNDYELRRELRKLET
ncbi:MAG: phage shock protein PspC [Hydrocarboniphaga sp.]|uniref:PspC domain-containing protein n=1 Tax=Hydrocarboniphaga sp. TaxID=2033016 RepID=UPI0026088C94|nr:PspC domain-containing protein [Hydrocarboniphaga sp.]MDB5967620.1 phage shock protein PspC [Hydrocarboniphaga sp.]